MSPAKFLENATRYPFFAANKNIIKDLIWSPVAKSDTLFERSSETEAALVLIAQVTSSRLYAGSLGAYSPDYGSMQDAKYKMTLGPPSDPALRDSYDLAMSVLDALQRSVAKTDSSRNLIDVVDDVPHLRVSMPVFDKRVKRIERKALVYHEDLEAPATSESGKESSHVTPEAIDDDTLNYPVDDKFKSEYNNLMYTHSVNLLPVFKREKLVEPADVPDILQGALVEIHFAVSHYRIYSSNPFDSFTGDIRQISVLKPAAPKDTSPYKRKNLRVGPFRPPPGKRT